MGQICGLGVQVVQSLPLLDQIFLASMILESKYAGVTQCKLVAVASRLTTFWKTNRQQIQLLALSGTRSTCCVSRALRDGWLHSRRCPVFTSWSGFSALARHDIPTPDLKCSLM